MNFSFYAVQPATKSIPHGYINHPMSQISIFNKRFIDIIGVVVIVELLSFLVFLVPKLSWPVFILILLVALMVSMKKLEYGLYFVLIDLFLGSKSGMLFSGQIGGFQISVRMALFLILLSVFLLTVAKSKTSVFFKRKNVWIYGLLSLFLMLGLIRGFIFGNTFQDIFFDFNGYVYFAYVLIFYETIRDQKVLQNIVQILAATAISTSLKTLCALLIFSYNVEFILRDIYTWIRDTGVGEITAVSGNFFRVFMQSQLYSMVAFLLFSVLIIFLYDRLDKVQRRWGYLTVFASSFTVFLSFSRSFWVGTVVAIFIGFLVMKFYDRFSWGKVARIVVSLIGMFAIQLLFVYTLIQSPIGGLLSDRVTSLGEAAASSRMNQLGPLSAAVFKRPLLGSGFGSLVTFITNDPRTRNLDPEGRLTTYAFEWGYLDIALKIGLLGLCVYGVLLFDILHKAKSLFTKKHDPLVRSLSLGLALGFIAILGTHMFSPYINHPLGIGYIILMDAILFIL